MANNSVRFREKDERAPHPLASLLPKKSRALVWLYVGLAGSLVLRISVLDFQSGDYQSFLSKWCDYLIQHGRWTALKDNFTGYPVFYIEILSLSTLLPMPRLYAVKTMSILCDYIGAIFLLRIVHQRYDDHRVVWSAALAMLFLPTVWFNSALWGQCDIMFTAALLAVFYYITVRRPAAAMIAFGFASAVKPQAILLVPFLGGILARREIPWRYLFIPPAVYALCGLPAILAGRPVLDVLLRWARHTNYPELTLGATNWYQWVSNDFYGIFFLPGIVLAIVATLFLVLSMQEPTTLNRQEWLASTALLSVLLVPYFLPGMHERYFYAADLFSLIYSFFIPRRWFVVVLIQFCSFFTYLPYLFGKEPIPRSLLAVAMTSAIALVAGDFIRDIYETAKREKR